jgi:hypothetical protein
LWLNVGPRATARSFVPEEESEAYTVESLGPGTITGEKLRIRAFGTTPVFDNVTSLEGDFGTGDDQLMINSNVGLYYPSLHVNVSGGDGNDLLVNQSSANATLAGGAGDDVLLRSGAADILDGGTGNDTLAGGANARLRGGDGDDVLHYQVDLARPWELSGGADHDTLVINGSDTAQSFSLGGSAAGLLVGAGGNRDALATGIETVEVFGRGGADTLQLDVAGLVAAGVAGATADLSRTQGTATVAGDGSTEVALRDDGAADQMIVYGTNDADEITVESSGPDVVLTFAPDFVITLTTPNRAKDTLDVNGLGGNDTFALAGPLSAASPIQLVGIRLSGAEGDDAATMPIGGAVFEDNQGFNTITYTVRAGDATNVTLTNSSIQNANGTSNFANLGQLIVDATTEVSVTILSTPANETNINLLNDGVVTSQGSTGPLNINLDDGGTVTSAGNTGPLNVNLTNDGTVNLHAATGPVTVTGQNADLGEVTIGNGLLETINSVTVHTVRDVTLDDSLDATSRSITVNDQQVVVSGLPMATAFSGVKAIGLVSGFGDDTVQVEIGDVSVHYDGGPGTDSLTASLSRPLESLIPKFYGRSLEHRGPTGRPPSPCSARAVSSCRQTETIWSDSISGLPTARRRQFLSRSTRADKVLPRLPSPWQTIPYT